MVAAPSSRQRSEEGPGRGARTRGGAAQEPGAQTPPRYRLDQPEDRHAVERLLSRGEAAWAEDRLMAQVDELCRVRGLAPPEDRREVMGRLDPDDYGRVVHLPWLRVLVRVLPSEHFAELRTARNRLKITAEEQARLRALRVGCVGASVGAAIAAVLAQESLVGELRLADFDALELSNLNRLHAGVHQLGRNKARLCAERIWACDPYLPVAVLEEGVTEHNLDRLFGAGEAQIRVLVEECDNLHIKLLLREEARRRRIPVLMSTDDRGTLDVERFDLEPDRPLLHGLLGDARPEDLRDPDPAARQRWVMRILDGAPSPRLARSFTSMGRNGVAGWPQLASEVLLGAAQVAAAVRRIGLGRPLPSGRYHADLWGEARLTRTTGS